MALGRPLDCTFQCPNNNGILSIDGIRLLSVVEKQYVPALPLESNAVLVMQGTQEKSKPKEEDSGEFVVDTRYVTGVRLLEPHTNAYLHLLSALQQ